jgi:hypothetical protein
MESRAGATSEESAELKKLRREVAELKDIFGIDENRLALAAQHPGVGSGRDRPQVPLFDHLDTGFVDRLAEGGVRPEDVTLLERAADGVEIVIPAHFAGVGAAEVRREGGRFAIERWAGAD